MTVDLLRTNLHSALATVVDEDELPALVEEAVWAISHAAGDAVSEELRRNGFPIGEAVTIQATFDLEHRDGTLQITWPVILPPLSMDPQAIGVTTT